MISDKIWKHFLFLKKSTSINLLEWLIKKNFLIQVIWIRHHDSYSLISHKTVYGCTQRFQNWLHFKLLLYLFIPLYNILVAVWSPYEYDVSTNPYHALFSLKNMLIISFSSCFRVCCSGSWISDSNSWPVHTSWPFDLDLSVTLLKHRHTHTHLHTPSHACTPHPEHLPTHRHTNWPSCYLFFFLYKSECFC